jgi:C4-dicarboxylate transporter
MKNLIVLIMCSLVSFLMLKYRGQVKQFTGDIDFAEKYLGSGGTNTLIVIVAILLFVGSLMYVTGTLDSLLQNTFGGLF